MKIVIITAYWKNSPGGGIVTYLANLVDEFKDRNLKPNVIFKFGLDPQNYHIKGSKITFSFKSYLLLKKIKPDIIYSQSTWYSLLPGYIYKTIHGTKLIYTFHTQHMASLSFFGKILFQHMLDNCDYVTFVSEGMKQKNIDILNLNIKNSVITYAGVHIPQKVDEKEIKEFCDKFGIKEDSIVLLAIGLTALKYKAEGAKLLIKSIKLLKNKYPSILLILTRDAKYSNELKEFAISERISDSIIFTGNIDDPNVPLQLCDLYTHTPLGEGLPLAILEAMAMGKPIIATPAGGIPEAIEDGVNGLIVQPDAEQIAQKIEYLLENKALAEKLGENAQKTVRERFSWKSSADKFLKLAK